MLYYENYDLANFVTPVNVNACENLLIKSNFDSQRTKFLVEGFRKGFSLGYEGDRNVRQFAPNLKFRQVGDELELWNKVMKEVKEGRYAGPYKNPPFENFIQSPIGLVSKDGNQTRLIFHFSYPRGTGKSINSNIPKDKCSVQYPDFSEVVFMCLRVGRSCKIGRSDMRSAFRQLGLRVEDFPLLVMKARSPLNGEIYYFVDKCLPFGASISCALFQNFSESVAHIVRYKTKSQELLSYLDDYFFVQLLKLMCNGNINTFLKVCQTINFPVSMEKTFWASTCLTFLGFLIDTVSQTVSIPQEKIDKALNLIQHVLGKANKKLTLHQLQWICGFLNFIGRCIIPDRAFTRRLYAYTSNSEGKELKPYHHIKVNSEMRMDLELWSQFLQHPSVYCRPFMDYSTSRNAREIDMYSDASKNLSLGMGAICESSWSFMQWDSEFIANKNPSIEFLELYALTVGVVNWIHRFANQRIVLFVTTKVCAL